MQRDVVDVSTNNSNGILHGTAERIDNQEPLCVDTRILQRIQCHVPKIEFDGTVLVEQDRDLWTGGDV